MADTTLSNLPTATGILANDALVYIVDDLASGTATSLQAEYQDFQQIRFGTSTATGGSYTLVLNDAYKTIISNSTATHRILVPRLSTVAFKRGTWVHILQTATGQVTVSTTATATGAQITTPETANARTQYSMITLLLYSTATEGTWLLSGDMETA